MPRNIEFSTNTFRPETLPQPIITVVSPSESLGNIHESTSLWPELAQNHAFLEQIKDHQETSHQINHVLNKLPLIKPIQQAIDEGVIVESEAISFFESLETVLKNEDHKRLVLYLPTELIPSADWISTNDKLNQVSTNFKKTYLNVWKDLLSVEDVRANFVDGDVIEADIRRQDPPRVVKAAHFIPELVKKGLINKDDVLNLMNDLDECVLRESINDVLPLMHHLKQINDQEFAQNFISHIDDKKYFSTEIVSEERQKWLEKMKKETEILAQAKIISQQILNNENLVEPPRDEIIIEAIRLAVVDQKSSQLFDQHKDRLFSLWRTRDCDIKQRLVKTFRHCHHLNLIDKKTMDKLGIVQPNLNGKFSENLPFLSTEIKNVEVIINNIKNDPDLNNFVLPVVLIGGSKVKGYGEFDSDTDLCIFIKPETPEVMKNQIRNKFPDKPIEFWLEEENNLFKVKSLTNNDKLVAGEDWAHALFNSLWVGEKSKIDQLMNKLLPSFFYKTNKVKYDHKLRELYFEDMERALLQYRLMYKGYENHFPIINNPYQNIKSIDGESVFWEAGYRRLATTLFINNVFLPKL